ncbi:MAG: hypothetical protein ACI4QB_08070 [Eubacteriales bacterium]
MKVIKTGPSGVVFTLASDTGEEAMRETARGIFAEYGVVPDGALELDAFVSGSRAVVFARCSGELVCGFDTLSEACDAALGSPPVPSKLFRHAGRFYIALPCEHDGALCEYAAPADAQTAAQVLEDGCLLCGDFIRKMQKGSAEWNTRFSCGRR